MMKIAGRYIGTGARPYIIAEMSGNHNKSLERAIEIVDVAAKCGADAIKLQTYTADSMTINSTATNFIINDEKSLWNGRQLYDLYDEGSTPWEWHPHIFNYAASLGIHCFSTPFDDDAVDFLETLNVPAYKIASFEIVDLPLIKRVASTKKPIIISTGMATVAEISQAVDVARSEGCKEIALLKCTSTYPADPSNTNLSTIPHMRQMFKCEVGLSDHTMGCGVAVAAVAFGATIIEKHFTLDRAAGGVDSTFSMEPNELVQLRAETVRAAKSVGEITYGPTVDEIQSLRFRRSLYIVSNLKAGDKLTPYNLRSIRPGGGLEPKYLDKLYGLKVACDVMAGTPMDWNLLG